MHAYPPKLYLLLHLPPKLYSPKQWKYVLTFLGNYSWDGGVQSITLVIVYEDKCAFL